MSPRVRHDDDDDSGVFQRSSAGAWKVLILIGSILGAAGVVSGSAWAMSIMAARTVVRPVEDRLSEHVTEMKGKRELMDLYVQQERERSAALNRKLDALCRASARPQVCLGGDE